MTESYLAYVTRMDQRAKDLAVIVANEARRAADAASYGRAKGLAVVGRS